MAGNQTRELTAEKSRVFKFDALPTISLETIGEKRVRNFSGVAYTGKVITDNPFWGNVVFDLHTMSIKKKLAALIDHDSGQRAGVITNTSIDNQTGLTVFGNLLSNSSGKSVAEDSDEGFPWQMSVHIKPSVIEEVAPGGVTQVNGREESGPLTVFRNSEIIEVSFTATGADSNTTALAMSRSIPENPQGNSMEIKQLEDKIKEQDAIISQFKADNAALKAENESAKAEAAKFSLAARSAAIKQLFFSVGREYKDGSEDVAGFISMPQEAFDFASKVITEQSGKATVKPTDSLLFTHQAATGRETQGAPQENPLMANAKARAAQFSKRGN